MRGIWTPTSSQRIWAAVSRALRTPSLLDITLSPGAAYHTEEFVSADVGYRRQLGMNISLDVTAFRGDYNHLPSVVDVTAPEPSAGPPPAPQALSENLRHALTTGVELAVHVTPVPRWHIDASYSGFHVTNPDNASGFDGNAPAHQWQLHAGAAFGRRTELDAAVFYVGRLRVLGVPAYTRADVRLAVRLRDGLSAVVFGKNLFTPEHQEMSGQLVQGTLIPRSAGIQVSWQRK